MASIRRAAGVWGPLSFGAAAGLAARRAPGYSHRRNQISGLAAHGMPSAPVMVPGFLAFGAAGALQAVDDDVVERLVRVAGVATVVAGLARCSSVECPLPLVDERATASDVLHSAASLVAFATWTALPAVAAVRPGPAWYRRTSAVLSGATAVAFVVNSRAVRTRSAERGTTQRLFFVPVFAWYAATSCRRPPVSAPVGPARPRRPRARGGRWRARR